MARPCPLTRAEYTEAASKMSVKLIIDGVEYDVPFKDDREANESLGFGFAFRGDVPVGGKPIPHMFSVHITAIGTKNRS